MPVGLYDIAIVIGPILPIMEVEDLEEAIRIARSKPKPLAFYMFSGSGWVRVRNEVFTWFWFIPTTVIHSPLP